MFVTSLPHSMSYPRFASQRSGHRPAPLRLRQRIRVQTRVCASASAADALLSQSLKLDKFDAAAVTSGTAALRGALGPAAAKIDDSTLAWFLKDRKLDVDKASAKVRAYLAWRAEGNEGLSLSDVPVESGSGKAKLLLQRDLLGRPAVMVRVALNVTAERDLRRTEQLCVVLMDEAMAALAAEGRAESILVVFDMRGFGLKNADIAFIRFFIRVMFDYYPKRIGQVLLVDAPFSFQPMWQVVKPLLGKYSGIVRFASPKEADAYFAVAGALL